MRAGGCYLALAADKITLLQREMRVGGCYLALAADKITLLQGEMRVGGCYLALAADKITLLQRGKRVGREEQLCPVHHSCAPTAPHPHQWKCTACCTVLLRDHPGHFLMGQTPLPAFCTAPVHSATHQLCAACCMLLRGR